MKKATMTVHPDFRIGEISGRLFGAFLEPIGSMVNGSMFNPKHPTADEQGLRRDFYEALKESGLPAVRLPGGRLRTERLLLGGLLAAGLAPPAHTPAHGGDAPRKAG